MVNPGRPSGRCASCKKRKVKCDELRPACSQCSKSGWVCPGYRHAIEINFRNETQSVVERVQRGRVEPKLDSPALQKSRNVPQPISPSLMDQGMAFFLHQYVTSGSNEMNSNTRGNHEYLPKLVSDEAGDGMNKKSARMALKTITAAAGLAGLANSSNSQTLVPEAYKLYGTAIRQIRDALQDELQLHSDETLATVMLMGTFETITSADKESMKSFTYHTTAAATLIEQRGPQQFKTEEAVRLFHQLRRLIVMTTHQMQDALPYALAKWSQWASPAQKADESNANRFGEINGRLAALRAAIKHRHITGPSTVISMLLPIENELEKWKNGLPQNWSPTLHEPLQDDGCRSIRDGLDLQFEVYPDLWVASMWNNYRTVRILIHETIMSITLKYGTSEEIAALQQSVDILREMATHICRSVAFHLGNYRTGKSTSSGLEGQKSVNNGTIPGGYILAWPLYLAAMLRTTPRQQKLWMASQLHRIAVTMGLRLAHSFAEALRLHTEKSFSDTELWFIGEFLPQ